MPKYLKMLLMTAFVCTSVILSSCTAPGAGIAQPGASEGEGSTSAETAGEETVTIRFRCYTLGDARNQTIEEVIAAFEQENPNINVEIELPPGDGYWEKLQTEYVAGTAPDITVNQINWIIPGAARGMFVDLLPYIEQDNFDLDAYFYPMDAEWGWQGGLYGGLLYAAGEVHYVNKELLEKAGLEFPPEDWTWNDLLEYAQAMTIPEENQWGVVMDLSVTGAASSFVQSAGGTVLNDAKDKCTLTTPEAREGLQFLADLIHTHKVMPPPATFQGQGDPFLTGKVGISFAGSWIEGDVRDAGFDWDFAYAPRHPETGGRSVMIGSNAWSILSSSEHKDEAWELVKYLWGEEGQRAFMPYGIPGLTSLVQSNDFIEAHSPQDIEVVWREFQEYGHDYYGTSDAGEWWSAVDQELSVIWSGEATVEEATERACEAVDAIFARRPTE
jgi:multiple sugar transport system substrate-binding protein